MTEVVAALIHDGERFLICQRPPGKARGGLWEFPGGKLEEGETPQEALRRECLEELDTQIDIGNAIADVTHVYPDTTVRLRLYEAVITGRPPRMIEHSDMRWIRACELDEFDFCPADVGILQMLKAKARSEP